MKWPAGLLALALTACSAISESAPSVPLTTVMAGAQCGEERPAAHWVNSSVQWQDVWQRMRRQVLNGPAAPAFDFNQSGLLWVSMGQRPTAGYGLRLAAEQASLHDGTARVELAFAAPPPGAILAQVITHPCLLLRIPRHEVTTLEVRDQAGRLHFTVGLPESRQ